MNKTLVFKFISFSIWKLWQICLLHWSLIFYQILNLNYLRKNCPFFALRKSPSNVSSNIRLPTKTNLMLYGLSCKEILEKLLFIILLIVKNDGTRIGQDQMASSYSNFFNIYIVTHKTYYLFKNLEIKWVFHINFI